MTLFFTLFFAGMLTILLPCILPLIPIVLGVSIAGRSRLRPLFTIAGMLVSFVGFTFLLLVVLNQFVQVADYMRIGTYYVLLLFGLGFLTHKRTITIPGALLGGLFFINKGWIAVVIAAVLGVIAMEVGGKVASRLQQFGSNIQQKTREELGQDNPITAFVIGLTMGLVWVPCAGPALGFAFTLVREQPGLQALLYLAAYGLGTAVPLLIVGYGGQYAVHSVRALNKYSGRIKQIAGGILVLTALAFTFNIFREIEIWFVSNTEFGNIGVDLEQKLFGDDLGQNILNRDSGAGEVPQQNQQAQPSNPNEADTSSKPSDDAAVRMESEEDSDTSEQLAEGNIAGQEQQQEPDSESTHLPSLPILGEAPELKGLGTWFNSEPLTLQSLRGKVVLVDFWTYSCINCIRTLPYIQGYWDKYKDKPFVLLGVHTPEFVFEKDEGNLAGAIKRHGLTYPIVQDNDYGTWRAFKNRYWPAKYLIDAEGNIRYTHFGEGAYQEADMAIASLLDEIDVDVTEDEPIDTATAGTRKRPKSPETYLGFRGWSALANGSEEPTEEVATYTAPDTLAQDSYALVGQWQVIDEEQQVLQSETGEIRMKFLGGEINLVMGMADPAVVPTVNVEVDGALQQTFKIDRHDLFSLWSGEYGEHDIVLRIQGSGAEAYAFTFGT